MTSIFLLVFVPIVIIAVLLGLGARIVIIDRETRRIQEEERRGRAQLDVIMHFVEAMERAEGGEPTPPAPMARVYT